MIRRSRLVHVSTLLSTALVCIACASVANAYSWQPLNTAVSGASNRFVLHGPMDITCSVAPAVGRTATTYSNLLSLSISPSSCTLEGWYPARVETANLVLSLTAIRPTTWGTGEGSVFVSGSVRITLDGICWTYMFGNMYNPLDESEFKLWTSQFSPPGLSIYNEFAIVDAGGRYPAFCRGNWYLSAYYNPAPQSLNIGLP